MPEFSLAWPWVFALLPLPWLIRWLWPAARQHQTALRTGFIQELEALLASLPARQQHLWRWPGGLALLVWLLLLLAATRPQWLDDRLALPASGRSLMLAVDISGSMNLPDMYWQGQNISRLAMVQQLFGPFIGQRHGDRTGLILFGSQAYLQAPLTFDHQIIRTWLEEARVGMAGNTTAIGDAVLLALKHLRSVPAHSRVLLLVTDGASNGGALDPLTAARLAASEQLRIYTVGIGSDPVRTRDLPAYQNYAPAAVELDEQTLIHIAGQTGGRYFHVKSARQLAAVGQTLDRLEPALQPALLQYQTRPLYSWPLAAALLISLVWAARRWV